MKNGKIDQLVVRTTSATFTSAKLLAAISHGNYNKMQLKQTTMVCLYTYLAVRQATK